MRELAGAVTFLVLIPEATMKADLSQPIALGDVLFVLVAIAAIVAVALALRWWGRLSAKNPNEAAALESQFDAWARARGLTSIANIDLLGAGQAGYAKAKEVEYSAKVTALEAAARNLEAANAIYNKAQAEVADARGKLSPPQTTPPSA